MVLAFPLHSSKTIRLYIGEYLFQRNVCTIMLRDNSEEELVSMEIPSSLGFAKRYSTKTSKIKSVFA